MPPLLRLLIDRRHAAATLGGLRATIALAAIVLVPGPRAFAQTPAPPPEPPPRLEATAQFAFLNTQGNSSTQSLGAGGDVTWRPDPWTYAAKAVFAQNESEDELEARSFAALFRASRALTPRLSAYGQYDFLRDVFAGVEQRHIVEGGLSYLAVDAEPHRLRFDLGVGYLFERRPDEDLDSVTVAPAARYRYAISTGSEFTYEPRFVLTLADLGAWKFDQDAALVLSVNRILSVKLGHTLRYSADPPPGFDTTDTILAVSLVAKLRRPM